MMMHLNDPEGEDPSRTPGDPSPTEGTTPGADSNIPDQSLDPLPLPAPGPQSNLWEQPGIADMYAAFTRARWYQLLNVELVRLINPAPNDVVVDLGTGTGSFARQVATHQGNNGKVICIDNAKVMLEKGVELSSDFASIEYRRGEASHVKAIVPERVNHITSANAMHLFEDPLAVLIDSWEKLPSGGSFSFSTGFSLSATDFTKYEDITDTFTVFLRKAKQLARAAGVLEEPARTERPRRIYGIDAEVFVRQMGKLGFEDIRLSTCLTSIPAVSILNFLALPGVGASVLPGVSPEASRGFFAEALDTIGVTALPRNWVLMRGTKP